ncbi:hypothetical protein MMC29_001885 [Sticta canariensis]|nr:hypothetical protein [Sticta canariensis]
MSPVFNALESAPMAPMAYAAPAPPLFAELVPAALNCRRKVQRQLDTMLEGREVLPDNKRGRKSLPLDAPKAKYTKKVPGAAMAPAKPKRVYNHPTSGPADLTSKHFFSSSQTLVLTCKTRTQLSCLLFLPLDHTKPLLVPSIGRIHGLGQGQRGERSGSSSSSLLPFRCACSCSCPQSGLVPGPSLIGALAWPSFPSGRVPWAGPKPPRAQGQSHQGPKSSVLAAPLPPAPLFAAKPWDEVFFEELHAYEPASYSSSSSWEAASSLLPFSTTHWSAPSPFPPFGPATTVPWTISKILDAANIEAMCWESGLTSSAFSTKELPALANFAFAPATTDNFAPVLFPAPAPPVVRPVSAVLMRSARRSNKLKRRLRAERCFKPATVAASASCWAVMTSNLLVLHNLAKLTAPITSPSSQRQ